MEENGVRLHLNECPWPPPSHVIVEAIQALHKVNLYPDANMFRKLRELLGEYNDIDPENIYPFAGADNALRALFYNLVEPGDAVEFVKPTFNMIPILASLRGLHSIVVTSYECGEWWCIDVERLIDYADKAVMVVLVDPNNPTGSPILKGDRELLSILAKKVNGFIVVDETYYEFSGYTLADMVEEYPNLVIVRSLSKAFCLAGLRLGYIIAHRELVNILSKPYTVFDIPTPTLAAGIAALENHTYVSGVVAKVIELREWMYSELRKLGFSVYRSLANFLLIKDRRNLKNHMLKHGIVIKSVDENLYRITIGSEDACREAVRILGEL
ncbi:MAG: aminotransferase class I/II-fold pyridoxal phosphate-dependent enzyme [Ignisphaera sp.]|nr:aminotransferase class I/II-fold pyridoxal phosphate-dependent enzyme [Ignisphaera sp.]MCX8167434.1 aminotransferase class I/II-fold pyridoxal phosphate-dependent enzyme [Ignisphaera sp.]